MAQKTGILKWVALVSGNMDQTCGLPLRSFNFEPQPSRTDFSFPSQEAVLSVRPGRSRRGPGPCPGPQRPKKNSPGLKGSETARSIQSLELGKLGAQVGPQNRAGPVGSLCGEPQAIYPVHSREAIGVMHHREAMPSHSAYSST